MDDVKGVGGNLPAAGRKVEAMSTASKVAAYKERYPEVFCPEPRCLWRTGDGSPCPRHPNARRVAHTPVSAALPIRPGTGGPAVSVMSPGERFSLASFTPSGKGFDCNLEYREKAANGSTLLAHRFVMFHPTFAGAQEWCAQTNQCEANAILARKGGAK